MIACIDVGYGETNALAACVLIKDWRDCDPLSEETVIVDEISDYQAGEFYRRELPCIKAVLNEIRGEVSIVLIDAYVWLAHQRPGLGAILYDELNRTVPVIGVAKNRFRNSTHAAEVLRGASGRPLFVTSAGISLETAAENLTRMHGPHRIPTILRRVDRLSRSHSFS